MGKQRNNSAGRLLEIFNDAWHQADNQKIFQAWSKVLGLDALDKAEANYRIADSLSLIRAELDHLQEQMGQLSVNADLYVPYLKRCRNALNISNLQNGWSGCRGQIKEDTLLSLKLCADLTPDEEVNLSSEELEEILQRVQDLREQLENSKLPSSMQARIAKHLGLISSAIQKYPIVGAAALRDGFRGGVTELLEDDELLHEAGSVEEAKEVIGIWGRVKAVGGVVVESDRMTNAALSMFSKGEKFADTLKMLTGG